MVKRYKPNNNNELKFKSIEAEEIIGRLKEALEVTSDGQLANYLGITRQNIGASRKRQEVPPGWIDKVAVLTGCSMDWLRFGKGAKIRWEYNSGESHPAGQIRSPQAPFPASRKYDGIIEGSHDEDSTGFGRAVEMLAKIYSSEDKLLINTITANIRAFCEVIERKQRKERSARELDNLKKRPTKKEKKS